MASFFVAHSFAFLDEEFDAPDIAADREVCRAIVAGKAGLHPDAWGNHDPLSTLPSRIRVWQPKPYERLYHPSPADRREAELLRGPKPRPKPTPRPGWHWVAPPDQYPSSNDAPAHGTLQLTCDVCDRARFWGTMDYSGNRPVQVAAIRALGHQHGWTCIAGTDRCPRCSQAAAPKSVGNGTGGGQGNEQHG